MERLVLLVKRDGEYENKFNKQGMVVSITTHSGVLKQLDEVGNGVFYIQVNDGQTKTIVQSCRVDEIKPLDNETQKRRQRFLVKFKDIKPRNHGPLGRSVAQAWYWTEKSVAKEKTPSNPPKTKVRKLKMVA